MRLQRDQLEVILELLYDEKHRLLSGICDWEGGTAEEITRIVDETYDQLHEELRSRRLQMTAHVHMRVSDE